jgi:hypothetical protein
MVKLRNFVLCVPALLLCAGGDVRADKLYRWVDKQGKVTYQDHPPPKDAGNVEEKELGEANIVPPSAQAGDDGQEERLERREAREKPRPSRRNARQPASTGSGLAPDDIRGVVEAEDVPISVISPGGDAAGSAKPAPGSAAAAGGGTAPGGATAPGAVIPPPLPLGP